MIINEIQRKDVSFLIAFAALIDDPNDLHAFNELVALYQTEMLRIARSVIHDYQLAEDAVQDAWYGIAVSYKKIPVQNPNKYMCRLPFHKPALILLVYLPSGKAACCLHQILFRYLHGTH